MLEVAANLIQPAAGHACPPVAADEIPPAAANVSPPVTTSVAPLGAATLVPLTAANVVANVARNATAGVGADGSGAGPASEVRVDKGKRPVVETDEETYGTGDEGDEEVNLSPDDFHFVLNRMFETRKKYINTIWTAKKEGTM
jgi:hypothetical protein